MNIVEATKSYEAWLGAAVPLVGHDIKAKHAVMRASAFGFFRATYYRWAQQFPKLCPDLRTAAGVLAVGDLHLENFGTWRDAEARLVWGINDFDEAFRLPYANDLVRLAASALIAIDEGSLHVGAARASHEILLGYTDALRQTEPRPFVLEEGNAVLRDLAMGDPRSPRKFWKKVTGCRSATPPPPAKAMLLAHMPAGRDDVVFRARSAGAGSLGLPRFVATRTVCGGLVARETKARAPSACAWAGHGAHDPTRYAAILSRAVRAPDPFLHIEAGWIVRRLAPHCESIALEDIAGATARRDVLNAMGRETANIHRGTRNARAAILRHLSRHGDGWLHAVASDMADAVRKDWKVWKKRG